MMPDHVDVFWVLLEQHIQLQRLFDLDYQPDEHGVMLPDIFLQTMPLREEAIMITAVCSSCK